MFRWNQLLDIGLHNGAYNIKVNLIKVLMRAFIARCELLILSCSTLLAFYRVLWKGTCKGLQGGDINVAERDDNIGSQFNIF